MDPILNFNFSCKVCGIFARSWKIGNCFAEKSFNFGIEKKPFFDLRNRKHSQNWIKCKFHYNYNDKFVLQLLKIISPKKRGAEKVKFGIIVSITATWLQFVVPASRWRRKENIQAAFYPRLVEFIIAVVSVVSLTPNMEFPLIKKTIPTWSLHSYSTCNENLHKIP